MINHKTLIVSYRGLPALFNASNARSSDDIGSDESRALFILVGLISYRDQTAHEIANMKRDVTSMNTFTLVFNPSRLVAISTRGYLKQETLTERRTSRK